MSRLGGVLAAGRRRSAAAAPYNPLTAHTWTWAVWAEDPSWIRPADGVKVSSWRDGSGGGRDATQATAAKQPVARDSIATLNNKPAVAFDGVDDNLVSSSAFASLTSGEVIVILSFDDNATSQPFMDHPSSTSTRWLIGTQPSAIWRIFQGTVQDTTTTTAQVVGGHFADAMFDATDTLTVDGTLITSTNAGTNTFDQIRIGGNRGEANFLKGSIAFLGISEGTTLSSTTRDELLAWSRDHYGTP